MIRINFWINTNKCYFYGAKVSLLAKTPNSFAQFFFAHPRILAELAHLAELGLVDNLDLPSVNENQFFVDK